MRAVMVMGLLRYMRDLATAQQTECRVQSAEWISHAFFYVKCKKHICKNVGCPRVFTPLRSERAGATRRARALRCSSHLIYDA